MVSFAECRVDGLDLTDAQGDIDENQNIMVQAEHGERFLEGDEAIGWLEDNTHMELDIFIPPPR